jgi:curved DNA-binding protein CbpA
MRIDRRSVDAATGGCPRSKSPLMDYYAVLGVNPTAEDIVIRAAYKALAQRYHPDRFAGSKEEAHRRMSELTQAYEVLADPVRRPKYDRRRKLYARAVAARINHARRFASVALDPRA